MIAWPEGVRQKVLRASTWEIASGVISDATRSGKSKTRAGHTLAPDKYEITMHMTLAEYRIFRDWFKIQCRRGVLSFGFPRVDDAAAELREYRIIGSPAIGNISGDILEVRMQWEEI